MNGDDLPADTELMRRIGAGDADAFDALFARHRRAVFGFALRMLDGDFPLAEDVTQEAFLSVWRARTAYVPGAAAVRTYLLTVTRNRCLDERKRRRLPTQALCAEGEERADLSPGAASRLSTLGEPERALLVREMASTVEAALGALPPDLREAALLRDVEGLAYEEIAAVVGCPLGTVKSRISAARARLRAAVAAYLEENGS